MARAYQTEIYKDQYSLGFDFLPYQIAFGISLRFFEQKFAFRIYIGPFKLHGSLKVWGMKNG